MGLMDDAKDAAESTGKKAGEMFDDAKERVDDSVDEAQANAKVEQAKAEKKATEAKNDYRENMRND